IPGGVIAADADMQSVNMNHRSDSNEGSEGGGRANDNEVSEARLVDGRDIISHVFLPVTPQRKYPLTAQELAVIHLLDPDAPFGMDVPLAQCPPFDSCMRQECIRSNPCWHKHLPQWDTVFVERDPTLPRIQGLDIPDEAMGLWVVQPDYNANGSPAIGVIHLDSVLCGAHLMPVFGDSPILIGLGAENSLDYINSHAFEITS
ncbi:hypothetical protein EI94DRAFT_1759162, partial [Lactarius quietus]